MSAVSPLTGVSPLAADRRLGGDRRARPTRVLSRHLLRGRRRGGRRTGEARDLYVDRFAPGEWTVVLALLALSLLDWAWTVAHLARGTAEANPLLAWTLQQGGVAAFSAVKLGVTGAVAAFLLLHARFRWTRRLVPWALACYLGVVAIHVLTEAASAGA